MKIFKTTISSLALFAATASFADDNWDRLVGLKIAACKGESVEALDVYVFSTWGGETPREGKGIVLAKTEDGEVMTTARYVGNEDGTFDIVNSMDMRLTVEQGDTYQTDLIFGTSRTTLTCSGAW